MINKENGPNAEIAEEDNQRLSNGRLHSRQPETDDFPLPFMTVGNEAYSSVRKVDAMETHNSRVDRDLDLARASEAVAPSVGAVSSGFHQAAFQRHHHQDGDSTSSRGLTSYLAKVQLGNDAIAGRGNEAVVQAFELEMKDLEELLSKLNPMAEEFVPSSLASYGNGCDWRYSNAFGFQNGIAEANAGLSNRKKSGYGQEKRRMNRRTNLAQRGDVIRRTVYVSDIDHQVTEQQLAALFINCGQVVDCRVCGDPNSVLRFAFIEFTDEEGARAALGLSGTMLGYYPVRVLPSKTAIAPVNPTFLPRSEDERAMCARTVYCTNIDKKVTQEDLKLFFESLCGEVYRLRLLGDHHYSTRIAFVEFVQAESATAALNCSGATLGSQPIRVSPSKTPVRPRPPRYSGLRV